MQLAERYAQLRAGSRVFERPLIALPKTPGELELQARWFAGEFGREFQSTTGEKISIVQFGFWNHETGPDFIDAAVQTGDGPVVRGAIELDLLDRSWESHQHAINPGFDDTVLHVFVERSGPEFFTRTSSHRNVPQVQLDLRALAETSVDVVPLAHAGRCVAPLREQNDERLAAVLDAAAEFRLRRKAERLRQKMAAHGRDEAIYQGMAEALGYKQNRLPFTLLAQRLPLAALQKHSDDADALLFGLAGFIDRSDLKTLRAPARDYVRSLWDRWWKYRDGFSRLVLPPKLWNLSGARPVNHRHRRLGALAVLAQNWRAVSAALKRADSAEMTQTLTSLKHTFWNDHYTLAAAKTSRAQALIGESRVLDILANVVYPLASADGFDRWTEYKRLRAPLSNRAVQIAAARLFADDLRQRQYLRSLAGQQGLLQIYEDFCLRDLSDCANCPFPEQMRRWP